jgi:hypothetical protein
MGRIDAFVVNFGLMVNDQVEIEWYDVVADPEAVVQKVPLIPSVEQMPVFHQ